MLPSAAFRTPDRTRSRSLVLDTPTPARTPFPVPDVSPIQKEAPPVAVTPEKVPVGPLAYAHAASVPSYSPMHRQERPHADFLLSMHEARALGLKDARVQVGARSRSARVCSRVLNPGAVGVRVCADEPVGTKSAIGATAVGEERMAVPHCSPCCAHAAVRPAAGARFSHQPHHCVWRCGGSFARCPRWQCGPTAY